MDIIHSQDSLIKRFINVKYSDLLIISKYCFKVSVDDGELWYHTLTRELIYLSNKELNSIYSNKELNNYLQDHLFLIDNNFNEKKFVDEIKSFLKLINNNKKGIKQFIILPTTACNARCYYCYELGRKRTTMDLKTALDVAKYIIDNAQNKIDIEWFGGEPLCNYGAIDVICEELKKNNINFSSIMVSNAYLFDETLIKKAKNDWHIRSIQITIDGSEEIYNKTKAYVYHGVNAYQRVLNNIELLLKENIHVEIRLNMDRNNVDDLNTLCESLINRFNNYKNFNIYTVLLRDFGFNINEFENKDLALDAYEKLQNKLLKMGYGAKKYINNKIQVNQCMADCDESIVILPDGRLGKCEHESEDNLIGSIYDDKKDLNMLNAWKETIEIDYCKECLFYPDCIKLKKCAWSKDGCDEYSRKEMTINLKLKLLNEFHNFMEKEN